MKGLGDLVALLVSPVGYMLRRLGWLAKEEIAQELPIQTIEPTPPPKGCGCKQRQQKLNEFLPFQ